ncbi:MAG TPA: CDP-diacylglycerol--glycerol-3-phosphate 3-phosphatidyltransferase [Polyangiaceae bacterium LLY-WYZ-15_(1-7)]|nr:CDP-diacylglycerol--glycerol-3-phosphate 3-phosphatidyltransferase [Myxococcales bacterium]MAT28157.1 CDP-diacylglycerol--glycerol-3-phosphate 3-phosphatidyltransferase [Sandaracinus sp.]HJK91393.1 CDP-diacylglycerol--glycerol-3-phosphate 3-phosphatidyltransferase [Polyangiaceae bacterium LLY-WYZ-15_(1-7)]HJL04573.1 CDP-diacylglycerol--glycerol-3-phosphate 3-phosphatidyltransferase [Polyangiaceae bacterium LLY-WYZ-15_(1-7)]HJL07355.1 CDP-diacylglycerol--glycerol-3-phosphate 3-phosphatidyltra
MAAEEQTDGATPPKPKGIRQDAINLPNLLTFLRIIMIPLVLYLLADGTPRANFWAAIVYILTAVTDFLDGWLARRMGLISVLGKFLDPLADKLLVMATLVFMAYLGRLPLLGVAAVILMVGRELSITALRTIAMSEGVVMAAGQGGKDKTALQMTAILLLIVYHPYEVDFFFFRVDVDLAQVGLIILYMSVFFAITSAGEYIKLFVDAVEAKERRLAEEQHAGERQVEARQGG